MNIEYIQILGYSAATLLIISFVYRPSHSLMRLINSLGCLLFIFFGVLINNNETNYGLPIVVANATILFINLVHYFLAKNKQTTESNSKTKSTENTSVK